MGDQNSKTALVTGANSGIGFETAYHLIVDLAGGLDFRLRTADS